MKRDLVYLFLVILVVLYVWVENQPVQKELMGSRERFDSISSHVLMIDAEARHRDSLLWSYFNFSSLNLPDTFICMGQVVNFKRERIKGRVEYEIYRFLKGRHRIVEWIKRLGRYDPIFRSALDELNLPLELRLLAVVESLVDPTAKSPTGPVGMWQFTYRTGQAYGLSKNLYQDQRKDPWKSTKAARDHLVDLYGVEWLQGNSGPGYHDWWLALAAYADGPGEINKAIIKDETRDYWSLQSISEQSRRYVPQFIALCFIFENLHLLGLDQVVPYSAISNYKDTIVTLKDEENSVADLARAAQINMDQFILLNIDYELGVLPAGNYSVKIIAPDSTNFPQ